MPYEKREDLPKGVRDSLPTAAQDIYVAAFNSAFAQYQEPEKRRHGDSVEEVAHKVAWAAVKKKYDKDTDTGRWHKK